MTTVPVGDYEELERELARKGEGPGGDDGDVHGIEKKSELGISGPFPRGRLPIEVREEIVAVIVSVKTTGIALYQACKLLQIQVRRIERWESEDKKNRQHSV